MKIYLTKIDLESYKNDQQMNLKRLKKILANDFASPEIRVIMIVEKNLSCYLILHIFTVELTQKHTTIHTLSYIKL